MLDEAVPTLAMLIVSGKNESRLNKRLGVEWYKSKGKEFGDYISLKIAKHIVDHFSEYKGQFLERATAFLKYWEMYRNGQPIPSEAVARLIVEKKSHIAEPLNR